jgi:hypothetical protein
MMRLLSASPHGTRQLLSPTRTPSRGAYPNGSKAPRKKRGRLHDPDAGPKTTGNPTKKGPFSAGLSLLFRGRPLRSGLSGIRLVDQPPRLPLKSSRPERRFLGAKRQIPRDLSRVKTSQKPLYGCESYRTGAPRRKSSSGRRGKFAAPTAGGRKGYFPKDFVPSGRRTRAPGVVAPGPGFPAS